MSGRLLSGTVRVGVTVNGERRDVLCQPRQSLLEVLRDTLGLTGAKEGCNNGNCGACNVILDGRLINACLVLAVEAEGSTVTTIEGIGAPGQLHPLQQKFLEHAALQCGVCTPGFIVSAKALLDADPDPSEHRIRWWLAGNLCRCTGYQKIVEAVQDAAATMRRSEPARPLAAAD
jgi:carbon-monoxide dehydrogenase small subunit